MNLTWVLHRLSAMSGREIGYRVQQQLRARLPRSLRAPPEEPPELLEGRCGAAWTSSLPGGVNADKYVRKANQLLAGEFDVFALRAVQLGFPPVWNRDPKTGRTAPLTFGTSINYRDESLVGDIKYLWEPSRHAELVTLAQAWRLTGERRYAIACRTLLESWLDQCPYPLGVHWSSSLELGIRLINWSFAWHLLGAESSILFHGEQGQAFRRRWLGAVYRHCDFISHQFSRYSSANNHLLGELSGLFIASVTWPMWDCSLQWLRNSQRELEVEALRQNGVDGVNREQANWYHQEVADMLILCGLYGRANGRDFSAQYWERVRAMVDYIASIMDVGGHIPSYGDADDAVIARLDPDPSFDPYASLLAAGAILFGDGALLRKVGGIDDKCRWLFGDRVESSTTLEREQSPLPRKRCFEQGGYYILGDRFETSDEIRVVADAGPLGYLSLAAHGHADALSFTLSAGGKEILIDPGTFAYHTQKKWRDYFRGTTAHNTVTVDGVDQSVSGGNFLWRTHASSRVIEFSCEESRQVLIAEHDGYRRLKDPVLHRRELRFDPGARELVVIDRLFCESVHEVTMHWHFSERCTVELSNGRITARDAGTMLTMALPEQLAPHLYFGSEREPLGWVSREFDVRVPCTTVQLSGAIRGEAQLVTTMQISTQHDRMA